MPSLSDLEHRLYDAMEEATLQASVSVAAPGAGQLLASFTLTPGVWEVTAYARLGLGGVPAAGDNDNVRLRDTTNAANIMTLPLIATQNSVPVPITLRVKVAVDTTWAIQAIGAGTASVVYSTYLVGRKVAAYYGD